MTIPIWFPFAVLCALSAIYPAPAWLRRLAGFDWLLVGCWAACLGFSVGFWVVVGLLVGRVV